MFIGLTIVFTAFPRSTFSELERRELSSFPEYSHEKLKSGDYTREISSWFSDSEPFRDEFMTLNMEIVEKMGLPRGEDEITIHDNAGDMADLDPAAKAAAEKGGNYRDVESASAGEAESEASAGSEGAMPGSTSGETSNGGEAVAASNEPAKMAGRGIIIVGKAPNARALQMYGGLKGGESYARAANKYKETFGDKVNVYCMAIPLASDFYIPEKVKGHNKSQLTTVNSVASMLDPGVVNVNVYHELARHAGEDIYLRTDHHWAPLGAYYAAREFCKAAGVHVPELKEFDRKVVKDYVGTMYGYSKDIAVKKSPEDFVYFVPKNSGYKTTYIIVNTDKDFKVTGEGKPQSGPFFYPRKDGSSAAYTTFMGGDQKITKVESWVKNGRKVLVLKDSYGNAIPGYLFGSFEEVHVIDFRYFKRNMKKYVEENGITDILFAHNMFNVYSGSVGKKYINFLTQ